MEKAKNAARWIVLIIALFSTFYWILEEPEATNFLYNGTVSLLMISDLKLFSKKRKRRRRK